MGLVVATLRRSLWVLLLATAGGAAYAWWRDQKSDENLAPAEWPPLPTADPAPTASVAAQTTTVASTNSSEPSAASIVNALVDAPEARSSDGSDGGWVEPLDDGSCPLSHPIKANDNSGIFHVPDGRFYNRTKPERCYTSADAAIADGYRQAKN